MAPNRARREALSAIISPVCLLAGRLPPRVLALTVEWASRYQAELLATHVELARRQGATEPEIVDALGIAVMVNAGAALVYSARTVDAFHAAVKGSPGSAG